VNIFYLEIHLKDLLFHVKGCSVYLGSIFDHEAQQSCNFSDVAKFGWRINETSHRKNKFLDDDALRHFLPHPNVSLPVTCTDDTFPWMYNTFKIFFQLWKIVPRLHWKSVSKEKYYTYLYIVNLSKTLSFLKILLKTRF